MQLENTISESNEWPNHGMELRDYRCCGYCALAIGGIRCSCAFGYIGAGLVWLVTFGHVRMEPLDGNESGLASGIGFGFVFIVVILGYTFIHRT